MEAPVIALNVCVVTGTLQRPPEWRVLASGAVLTSFNLKVANVDGPSDVIRISWLDAPTSAMDMEEGQGMLVIGRLRSYWAGRTVTDMAAQSVVPLTSSSEVRKHLASAMALLQASCHRDD